MTPERLNELAEMIEHDEVTVKEGREIAAFLRECAKAEPVAELVNEYSEGHGYLCRHIKLLDLSLQDGTKFYAHPPKQEQSPKVAPTVAIDERAEFEKWFNAQDYSADVRTWAWNGFRAARKLSAPQVSQQPASDGPVAIVKLDHAEFIPFQGAPLKEGGPLYRRPQPAKVAPATVTIVPDAELFQAIARGWCHDANKRKEMDVDLALAIAEEVKAMLKGEK